MRASVTRAVGFVGAAAVLGACRAGPEALPQFAPPPQISGTLAIEGLSAPVRVIRDHWGVPHIKAAHQDDLFLAQGFVQAQDRLFQMDLWRRSVQGRLSEVLGPNFVERDAMTRRVQFRGDLDAEWASYGADTRDIATAFTRGVNAWVTRARESPREEFVLAGWAPEFWRPEDLLNRTDAFVSSGDAQDEVFRARLAAAVGAARAARIFPDGRRGPPATPRGVDVGAITYVVGDMLRRVGTPPFFVGLAAPVVGPQQGISYEKSAPLQKLPLQSDPTFGSTAWVVARGDGGMPLLAVDPHRRLENPPPRYIVHLQAPGWNVIGAASPWLPGVAIGHNDRIAWGMTAASVDTQDIFVERVNPANRSQVWNRGRWVDFTTVKSGIASKGRAEPVPSDDEYTAHGLIVAGDRERNLAYVIGWSGAQPGAAAELAAPAVDRARSWAEFRAALARWKMSPAEFVYADVDRNIGRQVAALAPVRPSWSGALPVPADLGEYEWRGWLSLDRLPNETNPAAGYVAAANGRPARLNRIVGTLSDPATRSVDGFKRLQHDTVAWNAGSLLPLLDRVRSNRADVEEARQRLLRWNRRVDARSADSALYVTWERLLMSQLASARVPPALVGEFLRRAASMLVPALVRPELVWFDAPVERSRDRLLIAALTAAVDQRRGGTGTIPSGPSPGITFAHVLGISQAARARFNVGPFEVPGYEETVLSISGAGDASIGPSFRAIFDVGQWDRSVAMNAPGQSGSPGGPYFGDLAASWAAGEYFPLLFSEQAVEANAAATLVLVPK